jgi:ABC-2 type transport system permease protein
VRELWLTAKLDVMESLRARWFQLYTIVFGGIVVVLFLTGLANSRVLGFTGLSRVLLIYIQLCMAILPVFILLTTVRSLSGDREAGVFEYLLSLPVPLSIWYWGKFLGRFSVIFLPVFLAMVGACGYAMIRGIEVPWYEFGFNSILLISLSWCFLGIGIFLSTLARSVDVAQGVAFLVWLVFLLFLDLLLLGALITRQFEPETIVTIALLNPLQAFRTASMLLFDPNLMLMGDSAFVIVDTLGKKGFLIYAMIYPFAVGTLAATLGSWRFRRGDLP